MSALQSTGKMNPVEYVAFKTCLQTKRSQQYLGSFTNFSMKTSSGVTLAGFLGQLFGFVSGVIVLQEILCI